MQIVAVNQVEDIDGTIALFEVTNAGSNSQPLVVVMNAEGNQDAAEVHQWLSDNGRPVPEYSSRLVGDE